MNQQVHVSCWPTPNALFRRYLGPSKPCSKYTRGMLSFGEAVKVLREENFIATHTPERFYMKHIKKGIDAALKKMPEKNSGAYFVLSGHSCSGRRGDMSFLQGNRCSANG